MDPTRPTQRPFDGDVVTSAEGALTELPDRDLAIHQDSSAIIDTDQLTASDQLLDDAETALSEAGYNPPDREPYRVWGETAWEEARDEPLDSRLAAEEPEVWDREERVDEFRAGRLAEDDGAEFTGIAPFRENDVYAYDVGVDGAGASAEEAAVHLVGLRRSSLADEPPPDEAEFPDED